MRIALVTVGTTGDLIPYVALARRLRERGHEPYLVVSGLFRDAAQAYNVPARSFGDIPREEVEAVVTRLATEPNYFKHPGIVADAHARGNVVEIGRATVRATLDADLIVSHNLAVMGVVAAETQQKPLVTVHLFPNLIKSRHITPDGANYGLLLNELSWAVGRFVVRRSADPALNEVFGRFGLRRRREAMLSTGGSALLNLVAISPSVLSHDPDWPPNYRLTGYWFLDEYGFRPDDELSEFLRAGEPPVVITFGSVAGVGGAALTRAAAEAAIAAGFRAIVQTVGETVDPGALPPDVLRVGYIPHRWLFARARCIVSHGGAGTTAAAFRAGVPSIAVYHYGDQRFWGLQAARLGVAPQPLDRASCDAPKLATRIRTAATDEAMRARAQALGECIRSEDGTAAAARMIEDAFAGRTGFVTSPASS